MIASRATVVLLLAGALHFSTATVTHISPRYGSLAGGTRVTIFGTGFSGDQFSFGEGNEDKGNQVVFVSQKKHSVPCDIHKDGSTEKQIMCYTRAGFERDVPYSVNVKVDGVLDTDLCPQNAEWCTHIQHYWYTPRVEQFSPQSGKPGDIILTAYGRIITTRYGSNTDVSINNVEARLTRAFAPQTCELRNGTEAKDFYGLSLDSDTSYHGTLKCKPTGTFVGNSNFTFIVEAPYGTSYIETDVYRVSARNDIYMVQYYTDIQSISPATGSTEGGAVITVTGDFYEDAGPLSTYKQAEVYVGGTACEDVQVTKDFGLTCTVPAQQSGPFSGNRGVKVEYWSSPATITDSATAFSATEAADGVKLFDSTAFCGEDINLSWTRMTGVYVIAADGVYQFAFLATNGGELYADGSVVATSTGALAYSSRQTYTAGQKIVLTAVASSGSDTAACVKTLVRFFNTTFTNSMTGMAVDEKQRVSLTSTVVLESQTVTFSGVSPRAAVNEVQRVCVASGTGNVRLGLYGVFSEAASFSQASAVQTNLNKLPFLDADEKFTVVADGDCLLITFTSNRGNIPDFEAAYGDITITTTEITAGVPSQNVFSFAYNNVPSPLMTYNEADKAAFADVLQGGLRTMFGVQCPAAMAGADGGLTEDFEQGPGKFGDDAASDVPAFCGRYSLKNDRDIFPIPKSSVGNVNFNLNKFLCFAVKDLDNNNILLRYKHKTEDDTVTWRGTFVANDAGENGWFYTCLDLNTLFTTNWPNKEAIYYRLIKAQLTANVDTTVDYYTDAINFRSLAASDNTVDIRKVRLGPAYPNSGLEFTMKDVTVAYDSVANNYLVTMEPHDCGNDFSLLALDVAQAGSSMTLTATQVTAASEPVTGTIRLTYGSKESQAIDVTLEDDQIADVLTSSLQGVGSLKVESTEQSTCANRDVDITFLDLPGDLPLMVISQENLLTPSSAAVDITEQSPGHLKEDPIPGDKIATLHANPQVVVYINGVPTQCAQGSFDCDFTWSAGATPSVTNISPNTGNQGTVLTITGTGFSLTPTENTVTIGGVACTVTGGTATSLTCTVGNGRLDAFPVVVNVAGKGIATNTAADFTYTADVSSVSPPIGALGGNVELTVTGYGFTATSTVSVDGRNCPVTGTITSDTIKCNLPAYSDLSVTADQSVTLAVTVAGSPMPTTPSFTYKYYNSVISSVTPATPLNILGGQVIDIAGTGMGATGGVFLKGVALTVNSRTDTAIQVTTPTPCPYGDNLELVVELGVGGGAILDSSKNVPIVSVPYKVTKVFPTQGSLYGGTKVTLLGAGFGTNSSAVDVYVGDNECVVDSVVDDKLLCDIADTAQVHMVNNLGTTGFGPYFAFSQTTLNIEQGDVVEWTWETPEFVNDVTHGVYQTASLTNTDYVVGGIGSGARSRNGRFQYKFNVKGEYFFTSGYTDIYQIKYYRMTVVVGDKTASYEPVSVLMANTEPTYATTSGVADPVDGSGCNLVTTDLAACTPENLTPANTDVFNFLFTACRTPSVSSIAFTDAVSGAARSGTADTVISVTGTGLATDDCANNVMIGDCACTVSGSTGTTFSCTPGAGCQYDSGVLQPISINVNQYGYAIPTVASVADRSIAFVPSVSAISPTLGSSRGGTEVTITASGLKDMESTSVTFNNVAASCSSFSPLICTSPQSSSGEVSVSVNGVASVCTGSCRFSYDPSITPTVSDVTPTTAQGSTQLSFTGSGFGLVSADVTISVGGQSCSPVTVNSDTSAYCTVAGLPAGLNTIVLNVDGVGKALTTQMVAGTVGLSGVSPTSGSVNGGTLLTFTGEGFAGTTTVTAGGAEICTDAEVVSLTEMTCTSVANAAGAVDFSVVSNGETFPTVSYTYDAGSTPTVTSINPSSGAAGDTITIAGSNFGTNAADIHVTIGNANCTNVGISGLDITCTPEAQGTGTYNLGMHVAGKGFSNNDQTFAYQIAVSGINPASGDSSGNQMLIVTGSGFSDALTVTVCTDSCDVVTASATEITCITPAKAGTTPCDVTVSDGVTSAVSPTQYAYADGVAPVITGLSPSRGGTGGGTSVTITGTAFSGTAVSVSIGGVDCAVVTPGATEITCTTGAHAGSVQADVIVDVDGRRSVAADFYYVDVWSSPATWGGGPVPGADEMIVIPEGQVVLLDQDTEVLAMLLLDGGQLIFDNADIVLRSQRILINNGGRLAIGSEDEPFNNKGVVEMYGHQRAPEMPIYGTKNIAVRNGTLDLHGKPIANTWTRLAATAQAGATSITVQDDISDWNTGDEILIATTGDKFSTNENEKHVIKDINTSTKTITLESALGFKHLGEEETFSGVNNQNVLFEYRAEVGLLTRNVVVRGNRDEQWDRDIEACEAGFNPGEFVTQTCFEGRFGEEKGSSQFGAQIIIHQAEKDTQIAQAHISYTEVTFAGQAFRLGRYPIHFHLNGDMSKSYVKGSAIHETFNRAINIHGSHNIMIEKNVGYNVMGGAFFLEDGIETNNTFDGNLGVFVRASSSLLNDDITPATFWATNPDNTYINNAAAGGTHFGWWFRMHEHPDGPSYDPNYCPRHVPLKKFQNNSAHSFGWFGIWMFTAYYPFVDGACSGTTGAQPAVFEDFRAWNNEKGVEFVDFGALQIVRGIFVQNTLAGFEGKRIVKGPRRDPEKSALVNDTLIVGQSSLPEVQLNPTKAGIIVPYGDTFMIHNTKFVNFPSSQSVGIMWTSIDGTCSDQCGGYNNPVSGLQWQNVGERVFFRWGHEAVVEDIDGSLCGSPNTKVLPDFEDSIPNDCGTCAGSYRTSGVAPAVCPDTYNFHRFAWNNISPTSLDAKQAILTNSFGSSTAEWRSHRLTHQNGWMGVLVDGETFTLDFVNAENITNVSFTGAFNEFREGNCIIMKLRTIEQPDIVSLDGGKSSKDPRDLAFSCADTGVMTGDWFYDGSYVNVALTGASGTRRKRGSLESATVFANDIVANVKIQKCFFEGCVPPPDPDTVPPPTSRPNPFFYWSDNIWTHNGSLSVASTSGTEGPPAPQSGNDILIADDIWVVVQNETELNLGTIEVEGGFEIDYETTFDYSLTAKFIIVNGGKFFVGWQDNPLQGTANIILAGNKNSPMYVKLDGHDIGNKALAVFGACEFHGRDVGITWHQLANTVAAGSTTIQLDGDVSKWRAGDEVIVTSTAYSPLETERKVISAVDTGTNTITLSTALSYKHQGSTETVDGQPIYVGGVVGLLSRSIVIEGEVVTGEAYGGRVMASLTQVDGNVRTGYVRANFTQFNYMGQDGYTDAFDPRFALTYISAGDVRDSKPSIVSGCSFVDLFNSAVGAFGVGGLTIENTVVYKPVGNGLVTQSDGTIMDGNLVVQVQWTGSYAGRREEGNIRIEGGIFAIGSTNLKMSNNYVSNSERAGYRVPGEDCASTDFNSENNYAFGNLMGVSCLPTESITQTASQTCARFQGFVIVKSHDYGMYYNNEYSAELSGNIYADNNLAVFPMVKDPNPLSHQCVDKYIEFKDSIVIGKATDTVCTGETAVTGVYWDLHSKCRGPRGPNREALGVLFPQLTGGTNNPPEKPCGGIMSYNMLCGHMTLTNTKLVNFGPSQNGCPAGFAIGANPWNDDLQHEIIATGNSLFNVDDNYKFVLPRPNVGKINPADCVDMDCDAMKKALFTDTDGGILGTSGTIIPESEWQWGGDPRRGLSDSRVPKDMLTDLSGNVFSVDTLAPNGRGIYRYSSCTYKSGTNYGFYVCPNADYRLMAIESLDADTELRRLSPVAILQGGFIDLINGPQDHGWCSGYTCQKRVSTFHALVAPGGNDLVTVYLSSVQPDKIRYMLLNAQSSDCVVVSFYYLNPNRIDVFIDDGDTNIWPKNSQMKNNMFTLVNEPGVDYMPTCAEDHGSNYIDRDARLIYFTMKGSNPIILNRAKVVIVSFGLPAMSEAQFFGANIIENLAGMLNVPLDKVRLVKIVQNTNSGRRRRSTSDTQVILEIGDAPLSSANDPQDDVTDIASDVMDTCQDGSIQSSLGIQDLDCELIQIAQDEYTPAQPDGLQFHTELTPQHEGVALSVHPKVQAYDTNGAIIVNLGIKENPWELTASIRAGTGHPSATLLGTVTVVSADGWFNFTDLVISHAGSGYILDFEISSPSSASILNMTLESAAFDVDPLPMTAGVYAMTTADIEQGAPFSMTLDLRDSTTNDVIPDINWRGHTFDVTCGTFTQTGNLTGPTSTSFSTSTGRAQFDNLVYDNYGFIFLSCRIVSTPAEYDFYSFHEVVVLSPNQMSIPREATNVVAVRYALDFATTLPTKSAEAQLHQATLDLFIEQHPEVIITDSNIREGSIIVTFTIQGSSFNVSGVTMDICKAVSSGQSVTIGGQTLTLDAYMTVDGKSYYEMCTEDEDKKKFHPAYIALIVVLSLLVIGAVVFVLVWKFKIKKNNAIHGRRMSVIPYPGSMTEVNPADDQKHSGGYYYIDNGRTVFLAGPTQKIEDIFNKQKMACGLHTENAAPITTLYDETPGYMAMRRSPMPPLDREASTSRAVTPLD